MDDQIISIEHIEELEKQYVYRIHDIIKAESILDVKEFRLMLYLWECFDKEDASAYMKSLLADKTNKVEPREMVGVSIQRIIQIIFRRKKLMTKLCHSTKVS